MDEVAFAEIKTAVRSSREIGGKENHVTGLELFVTHFHALSKLDVGKSGNDETVKLEDSLNESGAVEAATGHASPHVGSS